MWREVDQVIVLIEKHLARRPGMEPRDVYKLLYQGVLGPEHLVASDQELEQRLCAEYERIEPEESDPLFESIHPAEALQRLNLRPYKARRGDLSQLAAACLKTARRSWGALDELRAVWGLFVQACQQGVWPGLATSDILVFTDWLEDHGFPTVHHSGIYRDTYRPAYRLIGLPDKLQLIW